jgi:secreted protein with Ig-like and vWFA domain
MMLAVVSGGARAQEIPVVTGDHWTQSTEQMKKAYLLGIANTVQIETAYAGSNPPSDAQSLVPRVVRGMKGETLDSVRQGLDKWYAANPAKLSRPVIETIWFEMVVPGLQKNK